jgi:hypothetical protein
MWVNAGRVGKFGESGDKMVKKWWKCVKFVWIWVQW